MSWDPSMDRRAFLAVSTTSTLAASLIGKVRVNAAEVVPGKRTPSETVRGAIIGLGGRSQTIAQSYPGIENLRVTSVCDCVKPQLDACMKSVGTERGWTPYTDFREMIEKERLDAVMVETTTHARAWVTCTAMAMGADVYIEKPMCLTIAEGRHMVEVAHKYGRVTQVGTQQRSIPLNNWASDLVKNGALGKVTHVLAPNFIGPLIWPGMEAQPFPEGMTEKEWDIWTNQAPLRPYHREIHHRWNAYKDYDDGGLSFGVTGWGAHSYDQIQRGLGTDETGPVEVILEEPVADRSAGEFKEREISRDETGQDYYEMTKNKIGPRAKVRMRYANGTELRLELDGDHSPGLGCIFVGEKGRIEINRDRISADPVSLIQGADRPETLTVAETQPHIADWVRCIKTRERCTADIEYGQRSSSLCILVNIARDIGRVGEALKWDPEKERFTNCDEGNAMLSRPRREGWELPS